MRKKEQADPELQKIKDQIEAQKLLVEPIKKKFELEYGKYDKLQKKLEKYRLDHGMFYPLKELGKFEDETNKIESICFVKKTKSGKFKTDWIFNDEILTINPDGTFRYSSYENGIIQYDKDEKRWCHDFYHSRKRLDDYVGFMRIRFNDENDYQVEPPDVKTYKD
jgi:hypothetical protein